MKHLSVLLLSLLLPSAVLAQDISLKSTLGKHFLVGTAVDTRLPSGRDPQAEALVRAQYNHVVAENCMKLSQLQPLEGQWRWADSDRLVAWAEENDMTVTGHCLVWHSQAPRWFFEAADGRPCSRDTLISRMRRHITTVMTRYRGRIRGWDVVNEALNDDGTFRHSPFYDIIGEDYIFLAFRFAHDADPSAELYLNDYSMALPAKREAMCRLVRRMKERGLRVDAVGMQSHNGYNYPDYGEYEQSVTALAATGVKVILSELDMNMLPAPEGFHGADISQSYDLQARYDPYTNGLPPAAEAVFNRRYTDLFRIVARHKRDIARVTFWCVDDNHSWLNDWPIHGRTNYPSLFDRQGRPKAVMNDIVALFSE